MQVNIQNSRILTAFTFFHWSATKLSCKNKSFSYLKKLETIDEWPQSMSLANPKHNSKCDFKGLQLPLWRFNTILPSILLASDCYSSTGLLCGQKSHLTRMGNPSGLFFSPYNRQIPLCNPSSLKNVCLISGSRRAYTSGLTALFM